MSFTFRPAQRENVGLLIGLSSGTGGGKTYSAMRLAKGICGDKPFAVIDTEARRAKHYADRFRFDHGDLTPPFTPDRYAEAIKAADDSGYEAIVVDSTSHEWSGDGGVLDMQEAEFQRMGSKESAKMASWIKPKMAHKHMVSKLLQVRAHLILCFRAEPKVDMIREGGRTVVVAKQGLTALDGWWPITEKMLPYELTAYFLLMADKPGVPLPIKLQEQHRAIFPPGQPITEECGVRLAAWAKGGTVPRVLDDDPTAVDRLTFAINACETQDALKRVADQVKALPKAKQELLRQAYTDRFNALKAPAREAGEEG